MVSQIYTYNDCDVYPTVEQLTTGDLPIALDTETLWHTRAARLPIYFAAAAPDFETIAGPTLGDGGQKCLATICSSSRPKIFQSLKTNIWVLERVDFKVQGQVEDVVLMNCLLDEHRIETNRYSDYDLHLAQNRLQFNYQIPQELMHKFMKANATEILRRYRIFKPQLEKQNLWTLYRSLVDIELVYLKMFRRGVMLDTATVRETHDGLLSVLEELHQYIDKIYGEPVHLSSPQKLGLILAKHFNLQEQTAAGNWKTDKDVLNSFLGEPLMQPVIGWKFLDKARQYLKGYLKRVENGRLYSDYRQTTVTGRSRSSDPNLENIPKNRGRITEVEVGDAELAEKCATAFRRVRSCIQASPGTRFAALDYKQIEYRMFVYYSHSQRLLDALNEGKDFHTFVAQIVFGEETPTLRYMTKILNYGLLYGMGKDLLVKRMKLYHPNPIEILRQYERMFPEMRQLQRAMRKLGTTKGYVIDPFGRRYHYQVERPHAMIAWLCQGTAANIKKFAMKKTDDVLVKAGARSGLCLEIHDELVFEIYPDEADLIIDIHKAMQDFDQFGIPILTDVAVGPNLLKLDEVTIEEARDLLARPIAA